MGGSRRREPPPSTRRCLRSVAQHPAKRHHEECRVIHEVVEVMEATAGPAFAHWYGIACIRYPPLGLLEIGPWLAEVRRLCSWLLRPDSSP